MGFFTSAHHFSLDEYGQDYSAGRTDPRQVVKRAIEVAKSLQAIDRLTSPALDEFQSTEILRRSQGKKNSGELHSGYPSRGLLYISPEEKAEIEAQLDQMRMKLRARRGQKMRRAGKTASTDSNAQGTGWRDEKDSSGNEDHTILAHSQLNHVAGGSPPRPRRAVLSSQISCHLSSAQPPQCSMADFPEETAFPSEPYPSRCRLLDNQQLAPTHRHAPRNSSNPLPLLFPDRFEQFVEPESNARYQDGNYSTHGSMTQVRLSPPVSLLHTPAPDVSGTSQGDLNDGFVPEVKRRWSPLSSLSKLLPRSSKGRTRALRSC